MTSPARPVLVLFSGLGADERLFARQLAEFDDVVVMPWTDPLVGEDLPAYAARIALLVRGLVDERRPLLLGGSSFGGMVALETARVLRPRGVVLIGSARDLKAIRPSLRLLLSLAPWVPVVAHKIFGQLGWFVAGIFGARDDGERSLFTQMLRASPPRRVQWACKAMAQWRPLPLEGVALFAVHGGNDHLLPARLAKDAGDVVVVAGAGHLLPLTHAAETNAFLRAVFARCSDSV